MVTTLLIPKLLLSPFRLPYLAAAVVCGWQTIRTILSKYISPSKNSITTSYIVSLKLFQ